MLLNSQNQTNKVPINVSHHEQGRPSLEMPIFVPQSIQIIIFSLEMNSTHQNKNFDVLQAILGQ